MILAHRGGGGIEPEATVPTMVGTYMRNPAAVIEFDVHKSRDGQVVVMHDATVDRTTNGTGRVSDLTLAELKALDAGYCATPNQGNGTAETGQCHAADAAGFPFRGMGYQVPSLQEVLAALPVEAFLSIEIKQSGTEREVADLLRASGRLCEDDRRCGVRRQVAARIKDALPEVPDFSHGAAKCFALSTKAGWDYPACPAYEAFASPLSGAGLALDTRGVIDAAHSQGMAVIYWTINDDPTMERLFRLGADGIYTDYPDRGAFGPRTAARRGRARVTGRSRAVVSGLLLWAALDAPPAAHAVGLDGPESVDRRLTVSIGAGIDRVSGYGQDTYPFVESVSLRRGRRLEAVGGGRGLHHAKDLDDYNDALGRWQGPLLTGGRDAAVAGLRRTGISRFARTVAVRIEMATVRSFARRSCPTASCDCASAIWTAGISTCASPTGRRSRRKARAWACV